MRVGLMYERGNGVPKDPKEAAAWYLKAATQGYAPAQCNLGTPHSHYFPCPTFFGYRYVSGTMYMLGNGVALDKNEAGKWLRKAAEQGHAQAKTNLGAPCSRLLLWSLSSGHL